MANNEDNGIDEIDQIRSNNKNDSNMATEYAKGKTKEFAMKNGKKAAMHIGKAVLSVVSVKAIVIALAVIILIVMLIGFVSFIFLGPDMVRGKVVEFMDDIFTSVKGFFIGNAEAQVKEEDVLNIANYLDNMGYKLEGYGFVENKDQITRDSQGKITKIDSKYIAAYLAAENKTYMIANNNFNLRDMFKNMTNFDQGTWGSGMIVINRNLWASLTGPNVEVNRKEQTLDVHIKGKGNSEETIYQYDLDGWMGRYGKPLEFLLALHVGTMAPDFAYEVATSSEMDTKVYVKLRKVSTISRLKYNGQYVTPYTGDDKSKINAWNWKKFLQEEALPVANNYIKELEAYNNEIIEYNSQPGAVAQPLSPVPSADQLLKEWYGINQADIRAAETYQEEHKKVTYKPYIRAVNNHWFRDLDFKDAYVQAKTGIFEGGNYDIFTIEEEVSGDIYQIKEPKIVGSQSTVKFEDLTGETLTLGKGSDKTTSNDSNNNNNNNSSTSTGKLSSGNEIFNIDSLDDAFELANSRLGATNQNNSSGIANNTASNTNQVSIADGMKAAKAALNGVRMDNGSVGCVEAVTKILAFTFEDFAQMVRDNVVNTDEGPNSLWQRCEKLGIEIIPFDISQVEQGDIIFYDQPGGVTNQHVLVADYQENGNWYVFGNSSSRQAVIQQNLYQGQIPRWIAKVSHYNGNGSSSTTRQEIKDGISKTTTGNIYEGYRLDELFKKKYKIADGINGVSDEEQPLRIRNTMRYALTMLENVHTLDAQCVLRDLKRYLEKRGFTFTDQYIITDPQRIEEEKNKDKDINEEYNSLEYGGTRYTDGDIHMNGRTVGGGNQSTKSKPLGGIFDGNTGAVEIDGNRVILYHKSPNHTEGFDTGAKVKAPGSGEVVAVSSNAITIKLTEKDVVDYKITISGFNVDSSITQKGKISKGQQIGLTSDSDIIVTMVDREGKAVNPADYLPIISAAEGDVDELARLIQAEDGMSADGMAAVAWVILNRVSSSAFPNTIHDVIFASGQFAPTWDGSMDRQASATALNIARGVLSGTIGDPMNGLLDGGKAYYFLSKEGSGFSSYDSTMLRNNRICRLYGGDGAGHGNVFFCQWSDQNRI